MTEGRGWKRRILAACLFFWVASGPTAAETLETLIRDRSFHEAMKRIESRLTTAGPKDRPRLLLLLADCQVQLNQLDQAKETLVLLDPRSAPSQFFLVRGQYQKRKGEKSLAEKDFQQCLRTSDNLEEKVESLCELALLQTENEESEQLWSQALEQASSGEIPTQTWTRLYRTRYEILIEAGKPQAALDFCRLMRRGLKERSDLRGLVWAYLAEIDSLKRLNRFEEAEAVWHRALVAAGDYSAPVLLMWGYPTLYDRDDPPALRRVLSEAEKSWSRSAKWSDYERYHVRMMQAQIWLHGFNDAEKALHYLQLAEPLASREPRPSGERMSVQMNFHKFGEGQSSDIEQVLWLQLRCFRELKRPVSEINAFMVAKLELLPLKERPAWLFTLGKRTLPAQPQKAESYFTQALDVASGFTQGLLLSEMMDTFYEYGQLSFARQKEGQLQTWLSQESGLSERFEVFRYVVPQCLDREWSGKLWTSVWGSEDSPANRQIFSRLFGDPARLVEMEKELSRNIEESELAGAHFEAPQYLCLQAQLLVLQGRYAEALAVCEKGQALDKDTQNFYSQLERLASYAHSCLGENSEALRRVRRARNDYAISHRYGANDFEIDCALLEIGYLLKSDQVDEALALVERYEPLSDGQDRRSLAVARSYALFEKGRLEQAKEALEGLAAEVPDSDFAVAVGTQMALILNAQGQRAEALELLKSGLQLARRLESTSQCDLVLVWHEIDPSTAPIQAVAEGIKTTLPEQPTKSASKLLSLAGVASPTRKVNEPGWLSRKDFLRLSGEAMLDHPDLATTVPLLPDSMALQAEGLPRNEVLVEYFVDERKLVVMVAAQEGYFVHRMTVDRNSLGRWAERVRNDKEAARQLGRVLVEPLEPLCKGRQLTILGHGPLLALPWDLLELGDAKMLQLHEWRLWAGPRSSRPLLGKPGSYQVLALGGISGMGLPASHREVQTLAQSGVGSVKVLTGGSAGQEMLEAALPQADILHLATHSSATEIKLSDGELTLQEIYSLPLRPGALVVLSSCEGADPGKQERGPITLAGAFIAAGASEVIASTERVGDAEAAALFLEFYRAMADGLSPSAALRRAKLARAAASSNGDWSKFVLIGGS